MKNLFWKKVETPHDKQYAIPCIEEGATLDYLIDKNKYIYFGGVKPKEASKDSKILQSDKKDSRMQPSTSGGQQSREGPSAIQFKIGGQSASIFGAASQSTNANDTIHYFDPIEQTWSEFRTTGRIPSRRVYHQSWYESPHLFIYGGLTPDKKILNDMYVLNCDTLVWKKFFWYEGPNPRVYSTLVNSGDKKYIIGGASLPENLLTNEVWSFSLENVEWDQNLGDLPGIQWEKINFTDHAQFPPTKGHSAIKISDSKVFIFGGFNQKRQCTDISIVMDTDTKKITQYETRGQRPCPRAFHKMLPVKENMICLFGGISCPEDAMKSLTVTYLNDFYILNLSEGYWSRPNCGGYVPSPRYSFSMASNQSEVLGEIILLGGKTVESVGDQQVYILSELESSSDEAWGIKDHEARLQFEGYREAIKKDRNKEKELKNVSMMTLEFSQAEKYIVDQKRKIGELETVYKNLKLSNVKTVENQKIYQNKIEALAQELETETVELTKSIREKTARNTQSDQLVEKVKLLLAQERKKRKLLQLKAAALQEAFKKAESFNLCLDQIYSRGNKESLFIGVVPNETLDKIDKLREEQKGQLEEFRDDFEQGMSREERIKKAMKQKKEALKAEFNVSEEWRKLLTPDEKLLFQLKKQANNPVKSK